MNDNVRAVLNRMGQEFVAEIKMRITEEDAIATGDLLNSIGFELEEDEEGMFTLYLTHADYFHYVNENTKPHWPPKEPIAKWIEAKPVIPEERNGKLPTVEQLNFLIRRKISEDGTQGHYFFERVLNSLVETYYPQIVEAIYKDIEEDLLEGLI